MIVVGWLWTLGGQALSAVASALGTSPRVRGALASGARRAAESKGRFDRGMQSLLGVLNLPTKGDYNRLLSKVEVLQGSLVNLNIKVDRVLAAQLKLAQAAGGARSAEDPPENAGT
jgi:hypothetical protein